MTAPCHLGGDNHEVGVWFEKQTLAALMVKKLLAADGSALSEVRMANGFYVAGCDAATTSKPQRTSLVINIGSF